MFIGEATHKGKLIMVSRDKYGKFFVSMNGQRVGVKLNASEMCRWFLNVMHEIHDPEIDNNKLREESDKILKDGKRIKAIAFVRQHRDWGLKQGLDYCKSSKYF